MGGLQVIGGSLTIGELVAFNTYLSLLLFPILSIGFLSSAIPRAGASALRVLRQFLAAVPWRAPRSLAIRDSPGR